MYGGGSEAEAKKRKEKKTSTRERGAYLLADRMEKGDKINPIELTYYLEEKFATR